MTAYLNALGLICALGSGKREIAARLFAGDGSGIGPYPREVAGRQLPVGAVTAALPPLPDHLARCNTRNNRLLLAAALEIEAPIRLALERYGAARIGIVLGTSTSGIQEASEGIASYYRDGQLPTHYRYAQQELAAPASFLEDWLGLAGPSYCISTACTSGARALQSARRLLAMGICDAVLCGGVDSLCDLTLQGFSALEATSGTGCNPFSANRDGIAIGEAAALFLMTRERGDDHGIALLGAGASSDAHHISAPDPSGQGAVQAMRSALVDAGCDARRISYLNLHGTATAHNDAMESVAVAQLFPDGVACSSTKPMTGHTLGAAGALEAAFCWLALSEFNTDRRLPPHLWDGQADSQLPPLKLVVPGEAMAPATGRPCTMSNSFAFGGNNISLIIGEAP
ncbi:beta-ketoacyl-[acyl-carrier-protein] synthase II [Stutzerimonas nosocomialis]|uniref:Beta-ketoacyl-[acyl-carrier-protein] synthase II n=1 Tax=Stutzerimonas nosocomialis TaxID=1056496 RepID=A0A5R9QH38_9GAMM|nr:beta-ketoacyl-[acyl-carrier-protein] synthase family protein [Stutzerimonas nosocomialis]TLX64183.1 beta-ketoacyl-[acyl-carrier-protein] synthase II [Stutzerimonas nosocomialis]